MSTTSDPEPTRTGATGPSARPRVAVVIPVRGHASLLDGVLSALAAQTCPPDQVVVVDDGPQATLKVAEGTVVHSGGVGPYLARNQGVAAADADVILFMDARCRPRPEWVEQTVARFADPSVGIVGSQTEVRTGRTLAERTAHAQQFSDVQRYVADPFFLPYLPTCNLAVRRADFDAVQGFAATRSGGDADLCWRVQRQTGHRIDVIDTTLMEWVPRDRLRDLLEQNFRYGGSHHALRQEWSDRGMPAMAPLPLWRLTIRTARSIVATGRSAVTRRADLPAAMVRVAGVCFDWGYWRAWRRAEVGA